MAQRRKRPSAAGTRKSGRGAKPARAGAAADVREGDVESVSFRNLVLVLERAVRRDQLGRAMKILKAEARRSRDANLLVPAGLAGRLVGSLKLLGICGKSVTGTAAPSVTSATITADRKAAATGADINLVYATGSTEPPCKVRVQSVSLTIGGIKVTATGSDSPAPGGVSGSWAGRIASGAGPSVVAAACTLTVVFTLTNTCCDTCSLAPGGSLTSTTTWTIV